MLRRPAGRTELCLAHHPGEHVRLRSEVRHELRRRRTPRAGAASAASANPNLDHVLREAADVIADLRAERRTVLVHCAAAQSRTPTVGAAYAVRHLGVPPDDALDALLDALPDARTHTTFREAVRRVLPAVSGSGVLG